MVEALSINGVGIGRAGSPSRPVSGWQLGSRRAARRSAPTTPLLLNLKLLFLNRWRKPTEVLPRDIVRSYLKIRINTRASEYIPDCV